MTFTITAPGYARIPRTPAKAQNTFEAMGEGIRLFVTDGKVKSIEIYDEDTGKREWVLTRRAGKRLPAVWNGLTEDITEPIE